MKASHTALASLLLVSSTLIAIGCVPAPDSTPAPDDTSAGAQQNGSVMASPDPDPSLFATPENWLDQPRTPGNWTYRAASNRSGANYLSPQGAELFGIICDQRTNTIELTRPSDLEGRQPLRILTETSQRAMTGTVEVDPTPLLVVRLQARDPLLDAMALTRGRFAVETPELSTLYLPAWAEVTRVIEDCR